VERGVVAKAMKELGLDAEKAYPQLVS
jgi:hypothetical protein